MTDRIHGAEAVVEDDAFLGRACLAKRRVPKSYRHPALDARIRDERTRDEANLLLAARRAGVPVPVVLDIDRQAATIRMHEIPGEPLRAVLERDDLDAAKARLGHLGALVARLHAAGITHGDLTTSNILVPDDSDSASLVLIDFGLGQATQEGEPQAVDLHLMEEALEATHPESHALMDALLAGYDHPKAVDVVRRLEAVRERGRYRGAG